MTIMTCASTISAPFFTQYMIRDLHWAKDQFAASTAVLLLSQFVFIRWWGRICDRHGNRATILATSLILPILPLLWVVTQDYRLILGIQFLSGMAWSGFNLASSNFIYDSIPADRRHRIFGYYNVVNGMFTLVGGSVIGAWCALVGILLLPHFKEVRVAEPITSRQILWRISTGEPIFNRITEIMDSLPSPFRSNGK
jgi:MFS family permease